MTSKKQILSFLRQNKEYLSTHYHISVLALYGFYARDEATENSDIDIIYERNVSASFKLFSEAEEYLSIGLEKKVELVNIKYMNPVIKRAAEKDFIYV